MTQEEYIKSLTAAVDALVAQRAATEELLGSINSKLADARKALLVATDKPTCALGIHAVEGDKAYIPSTPAFRNFRRAWLINHEHKIDEDHNPNWPKFRTQRQANNFSVALDIICQLKRHRLAVPLADRKTQFTISATENGCGVDVDVVSAYSLEYKLNFVSPVFADVRAANKAIAEVGAERIRWALEVFHGRLLETDEPQKSN